MQKPILKEMKMKTYLWKLAVSPNITYEIQY